ncbi:MAG: pyridoxamine 5'-phosphate oxidase family protein [Spirochaetes bacterium]|uniref:Pyridoxamine 5'-phosphate oxidase family protein n=1 Tax=Candidatus Ornithospirochaeta stercoripullorum TaxID=2840899 RepID=A0A9D9E1S6_9SPIO|nr:pyridoxamine 5'-phosphate oxidase family protein [Candidatus Ornithospirochaeta stercoripullorum]
MLTFNDILEFLKKAGTYYLATDDAGQPRVRPFGTINLFEGALYIQTGKKKSVSMQIHKNPKIEICAYLDGKWLRIAATAVEDDRRDARKSMLDAYPDLRAMYDEDDGNTEVFRLQDATAILSSFTAPDETLTF